MEVLGQAFGLFLVATRGERLFLIDQHAAHERVLYERVLRARASGAVESQPLLEVVVAPLAPAAALLAAKQRQALAALGWQLEPTDAAAMLVRAVPSALGDRDPRRALVDFLDQLEAEEQRSTADGAAAALACKAAVRAGDRLDAAQQRALLEALEAVEQPQTCPHGRPTLLALSHEALDRAFGRPERARRR
jgi:DNA mismatch repair protein MutL